MQWKSHLSIISKLHSFGTLSLGRRFKIGMRKKTKDFTRRTELCCVCREKDEQTFEFVYLHFDYMKQLIMKMIFRLAFFIKRLETLNAKKNIIIIQKSCHFVTRLVLVFHIHIKEVKEQSYSCENCRLVCSDGKRKHSERTTLCWHLYIVLVHTNRQILTELILFSTFTNYLWFDVCFFIFSALLGLISPNGNGQDF